MNFFNSEENPAETPPETPAETPAETGVAPLTEALLRAADEVSPGNPVDVPVPDGMEQDDWVPIFNSCYMRRHDFAHVGRHVKTSKNEDNGIVITLTDASERLAALAEGLAESNRKPVPPTEWPVGPATPLPEEGLDEV